MLEEDLDILQNLLERKRNYEKCIKNLTPYNGTKVITNYTTGKSERISARIFASIQRFETQSDVLSTGYLDERSEELLLPIFQQLLEEVQKEIDAVQIGGIPGKESEVKNMYSEEIQPMFRKPKVEEKKYKEEPSVWIKWGVAIGIGILLMLLLSVL